MRWRGGQHRQSPGYICHPDANYAGSTRRSVTAGQITYDLRRLRVRGLITRIPHTHRYRPTEHGLHTAMFISAVHDRFLPTGLAQLADELTSPPLLSIPHLPQCPR